MYSFAASRLHGEHGASLSRGVCLDLRCLDNTFALSIERRAIHRKSSSTKSSTRCIIKRCAWQVRLLREELASAQEAAAAAAGHAKQYEALAASSDEAFRAMKVQQCAKLNLNCPLLHFFLRHILCEHASVSLHAMAT